MWVWPKSPGFLLAPAPLCGMVKTGTEKGAIAESGKPMEVLTSKLASGFRELEGVWAPWSSGQRLRSPQWAKWWWEHYAEGRDRLFLLQVQDPSGACVGLLPWYRRRHPWLGWVLRSLGDREVATDHGDLVLDPRWAGPAIATLAQGLIQHARGVARKGQPVWDLIHLEGVPCGACHLLWLVSRLLTQGMEVWYRPDQGLWQLSLPSNWQDYLALVSKNRRKKLRRLSREFFQPGRVQLVEAHDEKTLWKVFDHLVCLHQKRWQSAGQKGCFASPRFLQFHKQVLRHWVPQGSARVFVLHVDGKPVAAEYQLRDTKALLLYQGGMDPEASACSPGKLALIHTLQWAMEQGYELVDFLRGDEPYKGHLQARRFACVKLRVIAPGTASRLKAQLWLAAHGLKHHLISRKKAPSSPSPASWRRLSLDLLAQWLSTPAPYPWNRSTPYQDDSRAAAGTESTVADGSASRPMADSFSPGKV